MHDRIAEAEREGVLGGIEGLKVSLVGTEDKLAQIDAACTAEPGRPTQFREACVRCPRLWSGPTQRPRIAEIRDNLIARISEAGGRSDGLSWFTSTEVVYGVTDAGVTDMPEYGVSP